MFYNSLCFFFFKQKTAYELRISDWSSDVCSSDLLEPGRPDGRVGIGRQRRGWQRQHPIADHQHVDLADPQRIARGNQILGPRPAGMWGVVLMCFILSGEGTQMLCHGRSPMA